MGPTDPQTIPQASRRRAQGTDWCFQRFDICSDLPCLASLHTWRSWLVTGTVQPVRCYITWLAASMVDDLVFQSLAYMKINHHYYHHHPSSLYVWNHNPDPSARCRGQSNRKQSCAGRIESAWNPPNMKRLEIINCMANWSVLPWTVWNAWVKDTINQYHIESYSLYQICILTKPYCPVVSRVFIVLSPASLWWS